MIYSVEQLKERIAPVAEKHMLRAVWVFGSYARGEATENSDVDFLIDRTGSAIHGLFQLGGVFNDLSEAVGKPIDLVTTSALEQKSTKEMSPKLAENVYQERKMLYERQ
jgi:predicted nucleotidyltransferase